MNFFKSIFYSLALIMGLQNTSNSSAFFISREVVQKELGKILIIAGATSIAYNCVHYQTLSYKPLRFLACYALLACGHTLLDSLSKNR